MPVKVAAHLAQHPRTRSTDHRNSPPHIPRCPTRGATRFSGSPPPHVPVPGGSGGQSRPETGRPASPREPCRPGVVPDVRGPAVLVTGSRRGAYTTSYSSGAGEASATTGVLTGKSGRSPTWAPRNTVTSTASGGSRQGSRRPRPRRRRDGRRGAARTPTTVRPTRTAAAGTRHTRWRARDCGTTRALHNVLRATRRTRPRRDQRQPGHTARAVGQGLALPARLVG